MKIVIDIPKEYYEALKEMSDETLSIIDKAIIRYGTPLSIAERYKPIILQEHDAEPRTMRAILDTETEEIYVNKLTRQDAEIYGMTIEEVSE